MQLLAWPPLEAGTTRQDARANYEIAIFLPSSIPLPLVFHFSRNDVMADKIRDIAEIPQSFFKEGTQFMNRCTKPSRKGELEVASRATWKGGEWVRTMGSEGC